MKKYVITILVIIAMVAVILGVMFFNKGSNDTKLQEIKLNEVTRSVFYAPQYVALNKGFFEEENLKIELTTGGGADKVMTAVLAGQSDIGFAGPEAAIYVYNEGKEDYIEVFAQMTKTDGSFLVSKVENENFKWEDVKGKTIIPGRRGGVPFMTLEYVLRKNGIDPEKDVILDDSIKFDLMAGAFAGGTADYVTLFEPTASMTQNEKKGYVVASVGEAAGEIPYTAYFAKKSYIENNPETIEKITRAIYKGQQWVDTHSDKEVAEAIQSYFPDTSIDLLTEVVKNYRKIEAWNKTPYLTEDSFNLLQEVMTEAGELKQKAPYDKIVNNSFAEKVIK